LIKYFDIVVLLPLIRVNGDPEYVSF